MKKKNIILIIIPILAIILEFLPYGAVLNFASPEETIRQTYSYFSLIPFGYANFGPFITAILTCIILVISILYFLKEKYKNVIKVLSAITTITSIMPLMFGFDYYTIIGLLITILLALENCVIWMLKE